MGSKRTALKCECGGQSQIKVLDINGIAAEVNICDTCEEKVFTVKQADAYMRLKKLQEILEQQKKKIVKIGNSMGLTLPAELIEFGYKVGSPLKLCLKDENSLIISIEKKAS